MDCYLLKEQMVETKNRAQTETVLDLVNRHSMQNENEAKAAL